MNLHITIIIFAIIWIYLGDADLIYRYIATNKKPTIQPYKTKNNVSSQQQCFAYCMYDRKCYAFNINIEKQLSCHFYNRSTPFNHLAESLIQTEYYSEFRDCQDWYDFGVKVSGVYQVNWMSRMVKDVRCNMEIDGGGWMTFQRRFDGSVIFHDKTWNKYKNGFGTLQGEFWFGLDLLSEITSSGNYYFLATIKAFDGESQISKYGNFYVEDENQAYTLHFNDTLLDGIHSLYNKQKFLNGNGMKFSTLDVRHNKTCHKSRRGAFWHNNCHLFRVNGEYYQKHNCNKNKGFKWKNWKDKTCLKSSEMLIKKMNDK